MPELPEVETTARKLKPLIKGKRILDLDNKKILDVERRGKAILIWLDAGREKLAKAEVFQDFSQRDGARLSNSPAGEYAGLEKFAAKTIRVRHLLAFHQRMSGRLLVVDRDYKDKYIRRRFQLSDGKDLAFHDVRRFGVVWYGPAEKVLKDSYFGTLGLDALAVSLQSLKNLLSAKKVGKIKAWLLDQKNLAGVGNIMADEILWLAKINPERKISTLKDGEIKSLHGSIKNILAKSIKLGGSSMRDWFHPDGSGGGYFEKRSVYGREGMGCFRCSRLRPKASALQAKILRKKIAGRSSYYCAKCQLV